MLLVLATALSLFASAQSETRPFEPVYAADQPTVAFDSMFREMSQFMNFSMWAILKSELAIKQSECQSLLKTLERMKNKSNGTVTEDELETAEYRSKICSAESERIEKRVENKKSAAAYDKLLIIQMGNPGSDFRKEIGQQLKGQIEFEGEQLKISQRIALLTRTYRKSRLDRALPLCAKGFKPEVQCDDLRLELSAADSRLQANASEIENNRLSLEGMKRSLARLFEGSGG